MFSGAIIMTSGSSMSPTALKARKEKQTMETKEQLMEEIRKLQDENQDRFIDELLEKVSYLCEKANYKSYQPTVHEKEAFSRIVAIVDSMKGWF